MRRLCIFLLFAGLFIGCRQPMRVCTDSRVAVTTPLRANVSVDPNANLDAGPVSETPLSGGKPCVLGPRIALIDVDGMLLNRAFTGPYSQGENPVAIFREKLDAVSASPHICAVVLRINSPGGGVTATDIMWQDLRRLRQAVRRPVVACILDVGAGGAYYLATPADKIIAHPTSLVGGIGVIWNGYNLRDLMALYNILPQTVKSGENIDLGTTQDTLSPEARALLQSMADEFHQRFRDVVITARPQVKADSNVFDGRILTAQRALEAGLVDEIGYLDDAVESARQLSGCPEAEVVLLRRKSTGAHSPYDVLPNVPLQESMPLLRLPGITRSELPTFLYLWQPEATFAGAHGG